MTLYGQKYNYNISVFTNEDAISYYLLGVFMTDGHIIFKKDHYYAIITSKDKDWLELIMAQICPQKPLFQNGAWRLQINNKQICEWLMAHGCMPKKSLIIKFPTVPKQYLRDFVRGCWDGDGCICIYNAKGRKNPRTYSYLASASKNFITSFSNLFTKYDLKHSIHKMKLCNSVIDGRKIIAKHHLHKIHLSENGTYNLIKFMYYDNCLSMPRKNGKAQQIINLK